MALMSSPEPMPVEVTAAALEDVLAADVVLVVGVVLELVVGVVLLEMTELMSCLASVTGFYRLRPLGLEQDTYQFTLRPARSTRRSDLGMAVDQDA
jgi:hypothetical protein